MPSFRLSGRRVSVSIVVLTALSMATVCNAGSDTVGTEQGVEVRKKIKQLRNNTGQDANDLHVAAYQKERGVSVNGAKMETVAFDNISVGLSEGSHHNDGKNHQADGNLTGGIVPDGQSIELDIILWLTKKNQMWLKYEWTNDGVEIGGQGDAGVDIQPPEPGGDGGTPESQEGDGGSDGNYMHGITVFNDMEKPVELDDFYALASTTYYTDLNEIDWTDVPPILAEPITINAHETWAYDFPTTGSYLDDGHIYLNYLLIDDTIQIIFDHPVPEPSTLTLLALGIIGLAGRRRRFRNASTC